MMFDCHAGCWFRRRRHSRPTSERSQRSFIPFIFVVFDNKTISPCLLACCARQPVHLDRQTNSPELCHRAVFSASRNMPLLTIALLSYHLSVQYYICLKPPWKALHMPLTFSLLLTTFLPRIFLFLVPLFCSNSSTLCWISRGSRFRTHTDFVLPLM